MAELALAILPPEHGELDAHDRTLLRGLADYWHLRSTGEAARVFAELARRFPSKGTCELIARDLSGYSSMPQWRLDGYENLLMQAGRTINPEELRAIVKRWASFWGGHAVVGSTAITRSGRLSDGVVAAAPVPWGRPPSWRRPPSRSSSQ